ncbi:MAG TPA: YqgE/AlgH family protein [Xanthobacteraceae bacterium]|nr:YqgE/AlgH family protein [Xanthobacteraceae bacterium]
MPFRDRGLWVLAAAVLAVSATALHAALLPTAPDVSGRTSTEGELLIAAPELPAPFDHAVVLMAQHSRDGAFGIVINHPAGSRPIAEVLTAMSADASGVASNDVMLYLGGPVSPDIAFVLHTTDYRKPDTIDIDGRIALTDAAEVLRDIGLGKGPQKSLLAFGYAGWAPAQLDEEIKGGAWTTVAESPALVFDDDRSKVWSDAVALQKAGK